MTTKQQCAEALLKRWSELEIEKMKCIKRAWEIENLIKDIITKCKRYGIENKSEK